MQAIVSSQGPTPRLAEGDLPFEFAAPANDEAYKETGAVFGPESELRVRFIGIGPAECVKAISSFPGGRRCVLVDR